MLINEPAHELSQAKLLVLALLMLMSWLISFPCREISSLDFVIVHMLDIVIKDVLFVARI